MKAPVSFIIPTRNEERNIREAIESVIDWAGEVFVLDSYSDDRTVKLVGEAVHAGGVLPQTLNLYMRFFPQAFVN